MKTYDDCIIFLLAKAYQKAHGNFKKRLHTYGLTPIQHLILEALWREDGLSTGDIGKNWFWMAPLFPAFWIDWLRGAGC